MRNRKRKGRNVRGREGDKKWNDILDRKFAIRNRERKERPKTKIA